MKPLHDYRGEWRAACRRRERAGRRWTSCLHNGGCSDATIDRLTAETYRAYDVAVDKYEAYMRACDRILGPFTHLHIDVDSGTITSGRVKP